MNVQYPCLNIARFVLETRSPLSIGSGRSSMRFDTMIVRDANGLPAVPGSSLAGVLRHLYATMHGNVQSVFGMAEGKEGESSRLHVSWGCVHDSCNRPVEGLLLGDDAKRLEDPLLNEILAEAPVLRRRVRMNERGAADAEDKGLFDRSAVPTGARFSFEICLYSKEPDDPEWTNIRALFAHPGLRLGSATRAGMGDVRCVQWHEAVFDLRRPENYKAYAALPAWMGDVQGMQRRDPAGRSSSKGWVTQSMRLRPEAGWRIGGTASAPLGNKGDKAPDDVPHHEIVIAWRGDRAQLHPRIAVAPASSIKGALAHRVAFHANCLMGRWEGEALVGQDNPVVTSLFGCMADDENGHAGRVFIEDAFLHADADKSPEVHWQMHTSLDRFTGGVRNKVLFGEEVLWKESFDLNIWVNDAGLDDDTKCAWQMALDDLKEGRLSLGGGMARGHGWFTGEVIEHVA